MANQCLYKLCEADGNYYDTVNVLANTALACATTAQAMILHQSTATIANDKGRVLMIDTGN